MSVDSESHMNLLQGLFITTEKDIRDGQLFPWSSGTTAGVCSRPVVGCLLHPEPVGEHNCSLFVLLVTVHEGFLSLKTEPRLKDFLCDLGSLTTNKYVSYGHMCCVVSPIAKTCILEVTADTSPLE